MTSILSSAGSLGSRPVRIALALSTLAALATGALGLFRAALALTLGAAVAIVSALWLADVARRLPVPGPDAARDGAGQRESPRGSSPAAGAGKFGLKGVLRYGLTGLALFGAVRALPDQVPWLLAGLTIAALAIVTTEAFGSGTR